MHGNRAVTAATRYSEGGTSTPECELNQSRKETTRGAGEARKAGSTARGGRQHGNHRGPLKHSEEHQTKRDNRPAAPTKAQRHEHHRATQEKRKTV